MSPCRVVASRRATLSPSINIPLPECHRVSASRASRSGFDHMFVAFRASLFIPPRRRGEWSNPNQVLSLHLSSAAAYTGKEGLGQAAAGRTDRHHFGVAHLRSILRNKAISRHGGWPSVGDPRRAPGQVLAQPRVVLCSPVRVRRQQRASARWK